LSKRKYRGKGIALSLLKRLKTAIRMNSIPEIGEIVFYGEYIYGKVSSAILG
jgi:hypothetical protein